MTTETTETTETTFKVPAANLDSFRAEMDKLAKRARKLAVSALLGFEIVRTIVEERDMVDSLGCERAVKAVFHEIRAWGPSVKVEGWSFVGRLDYKAVPGAVLRMMVPGETCPPAFYDAPATRCDHCGHQRRRNDTFILRHEDGREMIVGRTCLGDFLGHATPEQLARIAELPMIIRAAGEESEGWGGMGGGYTPTMLNPTEVLAIAFYAVRNWGWAPSRSEETSTRERVNDLAWPQKDRDLERYRQAELAKITDGDWANASAAIAWIADLDVSSSDYLSNLQAVLMNGVTWKTMGIAVSGVVAYNRAMERELERARKAAAPAAPSGHVGSVGDRLDFDAEVIFTKYTEGYYGTTTVIKLRDDAGNVYTWFASGGREVKSGERFTVRGTVKKHDDFRGEKQTVITRCTLKKAA